MAETIQIWSNTVAQNGWFHESGNVKSGLVDGVMSCSMLDINTFDGTNYEGDTVVTTAGTDNVSGTTPSGDKTQSTTSTDTPVTPSPSPETRKRSLLKFWSGATGTGNVLYSVWADKFISFEVSATAPTYI